MKFNKLKTLALMGSAIVAVGMASNIAKAAPNDTMDASITTSSTITALAGDVMDFGSWLIGIPTGAPASTLVMNPNTGVVVSTAGNVATSLIALPGPTQVGTVNVTLPAGANAVTLQMSHGALPNTLGAGLQLSAISYYNPNTPAQTGVMAPSTPVPITILNGGTGVNIRFGATITATSTPVNGAHGEVFNVAFAY